jgi:hypothetical protein
VYWIIFGARVTLRFYQRGATEPCSSYVNEFWNRKLDWKTPGKIWKGTGRRYLFIAEHRWTFQRFQYRPRPTPENAIIRNRAIALLISVSQMDKRIGHVSFMERVNNVSGQATDYPNSNFKMRLFCHNYILLQDRGKGLVIRQG